MPTDKNKVNHHGEEGQTFLEFVLLLMVILGFSWVVLYGINENLGERWKKIIEIIASPTEDSIELN